MLPSAFARPTTCVNLRPSTQHNRQETTLFTTWSGHRFCAAAYAIVTIRLLKSATAESRQNAIVSSLDGGSEPVAAQ